MRLRWTVLMVISIYLLDAIQCQKTQMTRTALHVARSLNPDSMEAMSVKTKTGEMATIIVKRRNGKLNDNFTVVSDNIADNDAISSFSSNSSSSQSTRYSNISQISSSSSSNPSNDHSAKSNKTTIFAVDSTENDSGKKDRESGRSLIPDPVFISSVPIFVKGQQPANILKKAKSLLNVDTDGIPVITGIRVPDDESDKQIWRNARVINGMLVPYGKSDKESLLTAKLKSPAHKPSLELPHRSSTSPPTVEEDVSENGWTKVGIINNNNNNNNIIINKKPTKIVSIHHHNPQQSTKEEVWEEPPVFRPLENPHISTDATATTDRIILQTIEDDFGPYPSIPYNYKQHPLGLWIPEEKPTNSEEKYVADKILDYIKSVNKEEMKRLSAHHFATNRDARMVLDVAPSSQIHSRILHSAGASIFPNSDLFQEPTTLPPSRVSFEEGVRTPVLQYAHPEYGVQSAKNSMQMETNNDVRKFHKPEYPAAADDDDDDYHHHEDRSPFAFEPAVAQQQQQLQVSAKESRMEDTTKGNKRSHGEVFYQRPKKTFGYFYPEKATVSANQAINPYYAKYPFKDNYKVTADYPLIYYNEDDGRPFWIRLGNSLKESVQSSIDKVTDMTRPVVEPIVEATNKISQNLGFSSANRELSGIRERLGIVAPSSLILPAIGIVAGGAALGLGAVAVGRYLNYDVVKMRNGKSLTEDGSPLTEEAIQSHLQSLWAEDNSRSVPVFEYENKTNEDSTVTNQVNTNTNAKNQTTTARRKRSVDEDEEDSNKYLRETFQILENSANELYLPIPSEAYPSNIWHDTPCSKKVFCETMLTQTEDAVLLMEKKIISFLTRLPYQVAMMVSPHLDDVMSNVRRGNCSAYICDSFMPSEQETNHRHNSRKFTDSVNS